MKYMGLNELREAYLNFFEGKGHLRMPSFSLVPKNDNSLLLINAGMAPLKPYFTGMQVPPRKRVTTCQKCIRTGDIDNVGKTSRHGTFFEMLGNFSFGDYFKIEVIPWAWEFITKELGIPKEKLYVTIYLDDDEAFEIWSKKTDIDPNRIFRLGKDDNFWEIGQGPCGPCSEIHFDRGEGTITSAEEFIKAGDEDRVVEFWNLVFTQFDKDENGNYNKLAHPNIDTGMGLERIATIMQGVNNIFEVDTMKNILNKVCELSNKKYGENYNNDISMRIITDHVRSVSFMISDGILPSNEGRGYVLRRLLRRAARHGRLLGIKGSFINKIVSVVIEDSSKAYSELSKRESYIKKIIDIEEKRFAETLDKGMDILKQYISDVKSKNEDVLSGKNSFILYDTYGFPFELTEEILAECGIKSDIKGFNEEMKKQKDRARNSRQESNYMGAKESVLNSIPTDTETEFCGYDTLSAKAAVKYIISENEASSCIEKGLKGILITDKTPFYAEMGGQVGDIGEINSNNFSAKVLDTKKNVSGKTYHVVEVTEGSINIEDTVTLMVDAANRKEICRNHTATHILDGALRSVLGDHVAQSGSFVNSERLRFDFTHFNAMTEDEIQKAESIVNSEIMKAQAVTTQVLNIEEAKKSGAIALFDEKYGDSVRVVSVGDFNKEFCGGTHAKNSGEIGLFKIVSENGVAAGIRRIEAVTGTGAINYINNKENVLKNIQSELKCSEKEITTKIHAQMSDLKEKEKEISSLKLKLAKGSEDDILSNIKIVKGIKLACGIIKDVDGASLREVGDKLRDKIGEGVIVLGSAMDGKVSLIAMASKGVINSGIHCGNIIKAIAPIVGGKGGGRPDMAQAGGKEPEKLQEALNNVEKVI